MTDQRAVDRKTFFSAVGKESEFFYLNLLAVILKLVKLVVVALFLYCSFTVHGE